MDRGGRSEGTGRDGIVEGLEHKQEEFEVYSEFDRKPVELLRNRGDVVNGGVSGDPICRALNQLKCMEVFVR